MIDIHTHDEWSPLREVVVGVARGARVPTVKDKSLHCVSFGASSDEEFARVPTGPYPADILEETEEDLEGLAAELDKLGIRVHRPAPADFSERYTTPDWSVDGQYAYCPRDAILTIGSVALETPMALRHRQNEARLYRHLMATVAAPRPRLLDAIYDRSRLGIPTLGNDEPVFDAANCLKLGRDVLFLVSNTGNEAGARWLQEFLGAGYRVHPIRDVYAFQHVDSTIVPLRPGLVMLCPKRVTEDKLPAFLRKWDKIWVPEPVPTRVSPEWQGASEWIAMNVLSLAPDLVVIERSQVPLMRLLERYGIQSLPVQLRHMRTLGGGPHCVTLDLVRDGALDDYS
jgi:glycine amidinotransferase/scyllo-inosamine-4-phosphate amidinotransferase 1